MKKFSYLSSSCICAIYACLALAAPLYACEKSVREVEQTVTTATSGKLGVPASPTQAILQKRQPQEKKVAGIDVKVLEERLKDTDAIGFFTKLAIRNDIVDLMDKIKKYRKSSMLKVKIKEIRSSFDGLLLKIIALLEGDPKLSRDLYVGRESIWESLLEVKA